MAVMLITAQAQPPTRRRNIEALTDQELLAYREMLQAALDNGSYYIVAGWHGMPTVSIDKTRACPHGELMFLLWHRVYLAIMEQAVGCPIPYWNGRRDQLPKAFTDPTYIASDGTVKRNPLHSVTLPTEARSPVNPGPETVRAPVQPLPITDLREKENVALYSTNSFVEHTIALEDAHNLQHNSVGGGLAYLDVAAYDPVFWSLHINTDRRWFQWQLLNPDGIYPDGFNDTIINVGGNEVRAGDIVGDFSGWTAGVSPDAIVQWRQTLQLRMQRRSSSLDKNLLFSVMSYTPAPSTPEPVPALRLTSPNGAADVTVYGKGLSPLIPGSVSPLETLPPMERAPISLPTVRNPSLSFEHVHIADGSGEPVYSATRTKLDIGQPVLPLITGPPAPHFTMPALPDNVIAIVSAAKPTEPVKNELPDPSPSPSPVNQYVIPAPEPPRKLPRSKSTKESPFPESDCTPDPVQDRILLRIESVCSTPEPCTLETVFNGRTIGKTALFGMGHSSPFVMDRIVDLTRAAARLNATAETLNNAITFQTIDLRTGLPIPCQPNLHYHIDVKCF